MTTTKKERLIAEQMADTVQFFLAYALSDKIYRTRTAYDNATASL